MGPLELELPLSHCVGAAKQTQTLGGSGEHSSHCTASSSCSRVGREEAIRVHSHALSRQRPSSFPTPLPPSFMPLSAAHGAWYELIAGRGHPAYGTSPFVPVVVLA